MAESKDL